MSGAPEIATARLAKRYGGHWAVRDLSMRVPAGQVTGFVGPNGAGKTTTLRMVLGLVRPSAGEVRMGEHVVRGGPDSLPVRVRALVERPAFYGALSGFQNVSMLANLTASVGAGEVDAALTRLGLSAARDRSVAGYSTGMLQRLALALCLVGNPRVVLLDEPTSGLDPEFRVIVRDVVRELRAKGETTLVISSHLLGELEEMIDHLVLIREGRVVVEGPLEELRARKGRWRVRATPLDTARDVLRETSPAEEDGELVFHGTREDIPGHVAALVARGVRVYEVREERRTLEDLYMSYSAGVPQ